VHGQRSGNVKLLVLGGTKFLGRAVVEAALAAGDEVTLFNRGVTNPGLFPGAEHLRGDRDGDLAALEGREWDVVIDPSGYVPRVVRASAELLGDAVAHYVFVSSISVYGFEQPPPWRETTPRLELTEETEDWHEHPLTMGGFLQGCIAATASDTELAWAPDSFLVEHAVGEWIELPLWLLPEKAPMLEADISRAVAAGLTFRPLAETVAATLREAETVDGVGLSTEREAELLTALRV